MKTVIQKVLKLWSFEIAKRNGSHFVKTHGGSESAKLPDYCHGYVSICTGFLFYERHTDCIFQRRVPTDSSDYSGSDPSERK